MNADVPDRAENDPAEDMERVLALHARDGSRARLLRGLARTPIYLSTSSNASTMPVGRLGVPYVADADGCHAMAYTSYRRLVVGTGAPEEWMEVDGPDLYARWPQDVGLWLNPGARDAVWLGAEDIRTVADIAAGLEVDELYQVGPGDRIEDFPGPALPDDVDCAVTSALFERPDVLEIVRTYRRLQEPGGRTWRVVLVVLDLATEHLPVVQAAVEAINAVSGECCEVHVADVHDDDVFDAIAPLLRAGVPLWRRDGLSVPDSPHGIEQLLADTDPQD